MEHKPSVSVVIPLYNKGHYISRTITSVLAQTSFDFEIVVVDDGSTDDGPEVVVSFPDPRVRLIRQENMGVSAARNRGVMEAMADLIAFLDADDEWMPDFLGTIMRLREEHPDAGAYVTSYVFHEQKGRMDPSLKGIPPHPWEGNLPNYFLSTALGDCPVSSSTLCMDKRLFWDLGGYPEGVNYGEDALLWAKVALNHPIAFSWYVGAVYHRDATNRACVNVWNLEKEPVVLALEGMISGGQVPPKMIPDIIEYISKLEILRARRCLMAGQRAQAKEILSGRHTKLLLGMKIRYSIMAMVPTGLFNSIWKIKRHISKGLFGIDYGDDPFFKD